jgi:hypothetical protein
MYIDLQYVRGSVHTVKNKTEALLFASKQNGLGGNAYKTKYIVMSHDQNGGEVTI